MNRLFAFGMVATAAGLVACEEETLVRQVPGALQVPSSVDFGDVPLGIRVSRTVELQNRGGSSLTLTGVEVVEPVNALSVVLSDPSPTEVPPGGAAQLTIDLIALRAEDEPGQVRIRVEGESIDTPLEGGFPVRGRGVDTAVFVRPNPLEFGRIRVGTSAERAVEVVNLRSEPVDLTVPFEGTDADFESGGDFFRLLTPVDPDRNGSLLAEGEMLMPGEAALLRFRYTPDTQSIETTNSGELVLRTCDDPQCEARLRLAGVGVRQGLVCEPAAVDFGAVPPGTEPTEFVRCTNENNVDLEIVNWGLDRDTDDTFSVDPFRGEPLLLEAGQVFEMAVSFEARSDALGEAQFGRIVVQGAGEDDREPIPVAEIDLSGTAGGPVVQVSPEVVDFGTVRVGQGGNASMAISNVGFADLSITRLEVEGPVAFTVGQPPNTLSQGFTREVDLRFVPDAPGPFEGALVLESNDPLRGELRIPIRGVGLDVGPCQYEAQPPELAFGPVPVNGSIRDDLVLRNTGTESCVFREFRLDGQDAEAYELADVPDPSVVVPPGRVVVLGVVLSPRSTTDYFADLTFSASNNAPQRERVPLSGFGGTADLLVAPTSLDFGTVELGCGVTPQRVQITNVSTGVREIDLFEQVTLLGDENAYRLESLPSGLPPLSGDTRSINPGQTLSFSVRFASALEGESLGRLNIGVQNRPTSYAVRLRGRAEEDAVRVERFAQGETGKIDVLFVLDNSFSMRNRIDFIRDQTAELFDVIDAANVDYQVGLVTTDIEGIVNGQVAGPCGFPSAQPPGNWVRGSCGFLSDGNDRDNRPEWRIIQPNELPSPGDAFREVLEVPFPGNPRETGLQAMADALTPPIASGWNDGFVRPDADLAVIVLSDDNDFSSRPVDFYVGLVRSLKAGSGNRATINAIVPADRGECNEFEKPELCFTRDSRYRAAAVLTDGVVLPQGGTDGAPFDQQAEEYAERIIRVLDASLSTRRSFRLQGTPAPGTVQVFIDGAPLPRSSPAGGENWSYDDTNNRVVFTDRGRPLPGQDFEVRYRNLCF
jgi:hypothetical protein